MRSVDLVEPPQKIFGSPVDIIAPWIIGEIIAQGRSTEFLFEQINFIEKEDDTSSHKPARVDHRVEQHEAFHHSVLYWRRQRYQKSDQQHYLVTLLQQDLIVFTQGHTEYYWRDVFKTMYPFFSFAPLPSDIKHTEYTHQPPNTWNEKTQSYCILNWPIVKRVS